jgi:patatin-related protein
MTESRRADLGEPANSRSRTLRLALAMRGGVSLAVWIGGAVAELDLFRRACNAPGNSPQDFTLPARENSRHHERALLYRELLATTKYERVQIDILAGASAGGLNAVLVALAQSCGVVMDETVRRTWVERGALWDLLRDPGFGRVPSILKGDERLFTLADKALTALASPSSVDDRWRPPPHPGTAASRLTVELAATLLDDPLDPDRKNEAGFSFTKTPGCLGCGFTTIPDQATDEDERRAIARMAFAARSTSSFPGAFEPAQVHAVNRGPVSPATAEGTALPAPQTVVDVPDPTVDMSTAFLYAREQHEPAAPYFVVDGGIFDNIPIDRAIRTIQRSPASMPSERRLVYLDPEPPLPTPPNLESNKASVVDWVPVIRRSTVLKQRTETAEGEIDGILQNNEAVRAQQARLNLMAAELDGLGSANTAAPALGLDERLQAYLQTRVVADGQRFATLLTDPSSELCRPPYQARDYSPLEPTAALSLEAWTSACYLDASAGAWQSAEGPYANIESGQDVLAGIEQVRTLIGWVHALENVAEGAAIRDMPQADGSTPAEQLAHWKQTCYRCLTLLVAAKHRTIDEVLAAPLLASSPPRPLAYTQDVFTAKLTKSLLEQNRLCVSTELIGLIQANTSASDFYDRLGGSGAFIAEPAPSGDGWQHFLPTIKTALQDIKADLIDRSSAWLPANPQAPATTWQAEWKRSIYRRFHGPALAGRPVSDLSRLLATVGGATSSSFIFYHRITSDEPPALGSEFAALAKAARAKQLEAWVRRIPKKVIPREPSHQDDDPRVVHPEMMRAITRSLDRPLLADAKLAGNALNRFGGFFRARWRENDWQWGRLDAAAGIARLLNGTRGDRALPPALADDRLVAPLQASIVAESRATVAATQDKPAIVATAGADTLNTISPRYRFSLASRAVPLIYRALLPPQVSGLSIQRGLGLTAQIVLRLLAVPLVLIADPLRLAWALVAVLGSAAALGAGGSTNHWRELSSTMLVLVAGAIAARARRAGRNWRDVRKRLVSISDCDPNLRVAQDWIPVLDDRRPGGWRACSFILASVVGLSALYELFAVPGGFEDRGHPIFYMPTEAFFVWAFFVFGAQHYFNQRAYQVQENPPPMWGRTLWSVAAGVAAVLVVALAEFHAHYQATEIGAALDWPWDRCPTTWVVAAIAAAVLTFMSMWGWTKTWAAVVCIVATAAIAAALQARFDHGAPSCDLMPTAVWLVVVGLVLPLMPVRGTESHDGDDPGGARRRLDADYGETDRPVVLS